jgi:CheY-like chemotaxis protein
MIECKRINVLFADDSEIHHLLFKALLESKQRFNLMHCVINGKHLVDYIFHSAVIPDVCVLDLHMPVLNGIDACQQIKRSFPNIVLLGFTSSSDDREKQEMVNAGAQRVFPKENLKELIDYLDKGSFN